MKPKPDFSVIYRIGNPDSWELIEIYDLDPVLEISYVLFKQLDILGDGGMQAETVVGTRYRWP